MAASSQEAEDAPPDRGDAAEETVRRRSPILLAWFAWYARRYVARHFDALRISRRGRPPDPDGGPLIVVLNHPSWWDPLVCLLLSDLFPGRAHYAPIDAAALRRYRFFGRLGFFGVEQGTARGAAAFLRTSRAILSRHDTAVWITGQGRFVDPRDRPVTLRPGVAHLARRLGRGTVLPLALEYPFWEERLPEALASFGAPIRIERGARSLADWQDRIETGLAETLDALSSEARSREPSAFEPVIRGRKGIGGIYDLWRRMVAAARGEPFRPEHGNREGPEPGR